jgi:3-phosphoshikimate 1-carboxyvinyltransferase
MKVSGTVRVPGDKSISHRALILSSLADGTSRIRGILDSEDIQSTASVLRLLGVDVPELTSDFIITGKGLRGFTQPTRDLDCGNSGTTARLITGAIAGNEIHARIVGDESLSKRPMRRVTEPLAEMGAVIEYPESKDSLPITITGGKLYALDWDNVTSSAQVKSAILLAGLSGKASVTVSEKIPSRDHTERMLRAMGAKVETVKREVALKPVKSLAPLDIQIPGDPSSAAFFIAAAVLAESGELTIENVCLNTTRTGFIMILIAAGASIEYQNERLSGGELVGDIVVRPASLGAIEVEAEDIVSMIDEIPLLACVAAAAGVEARVTGAGELRVKESDRIAVIVSNLKALGVDIEELPDGFHIKEGTSQLAGSVVTHKDHRIAMSFGVLERFTGGGVKLDERESVAVSYPEFWNDLNRVIQ